jgi:hypothetical protein
MVPLDALQPPGLLQHDAHMVILHNDISLHNGADATTAWTVLFALIQLALQSLASLVIVVPPNVMAW